MKYIRTKDKVYEVTNDKYRVFEENGVFKIHCENMGHHWDSELDVIAQADTIEELCDEFVDDTYKDFYKIKKENGKTFVWSIKQRFKYWNSIDFDFIGTIYGAIYTSKGLIYVAKMNEKGCLELI